MTYVFVACVYNRHDYLPVHKPAQSLLAILTGNFAVQGCPWLAKCPAGSASADISMGGFFALFLMLLVLWLAYVAFSAYIKCVQVSYWPYLPSADCTARCQLLY